MTSIRGAQPLSLFEILLLTKKQRDENMSTDNISPIEQRQYFVVSLSWKIVAYRTLL